MTANASTLSLAPVDRRNVTVGSEPVPRRQPMGLAARVARAGHEAIARLVPSNGRPAILFEWDGGELRIEPDEDEAGSELASALDLDVHVLRGREGGRLILGPDGGPAFLNGWPVPVATPQLLVHGDVLRIGDRLVAVRYDPPIRPLVAAGDLRTLPPPRDVGEGFHLAIEPTGEPLEMRFDASLTRALAAIVLRHDASRAFDPTAISDVERATLDWLVHHIADKVAGDVMGSRISLRPAARGARPEVWASLAVRIGSTHGAAWIGSTHAGSQAIAGALEPVTRRQYAANPSVRGIHVTLSARLDVGRVPATSAAALEAGDLIVARGVDWLGDSGWNCEGQLVLSGADEIAPDARFELDQDGHLLAEILGTSFNDGGTRMEATHAVETLNPDDRPFGDALDAIGVVVTIEMGRKRIRLSEALSLASGDVIDLGAPITAHVSLLIDGAPFARGELVDVEGALGVRIVAMGGRR